ncbi:DUF4861 domain-containing protein [bacterium]|nr:DUF4861 domain-containing protein [bacterium]
MMRKSLCVLVLLLGMVVRSGAADFPWYVEYSIPEASGRQTGEPFAPTARVVIEVTNPHDFAVPRAGVIVKRDQLPVTNLYEDWVTPVDPNQPGQASPPSKVIWEQGTVLKGKEENGHYLVYQADDLDKDGLWDELFFQVDMKARETKPIVLYFGANERGLFVHETHAEIGSYGKHLIPWWESESMGWKLWFIDSVDMNGKTFPTLKAYEEDQENVSGHVSPKKYGNDIMWVSATFGAGGICVVENPSDPEHVARPRFSDENTSLVGQRFIGTNVGRGPVFDSRAAYDVVVNGPLRSTVRIYTYNWGTTHGRYECVQDYTAYAKKNYTTCHTTFTKFTPDDNDVAMGVGMRKIMSESSSSHTDSLAISEGKNLDIWDINAIRKPGKKYLIDWEGIAIAVKDSLGSKYHSMKTQDGNHLLYFPVPENRSFDYIMLAGWSKGYQVKSSDEFHQYVKENVAAFNEPMQVKIGQLETIEKK